MRILLHVILRSAKTHPVQLKSRFEEGLLKDKLPFFKHFLLKSSMLVRRKVACRTPVPLL